MYHWGGSGSSEGRRGWRHDDRLPMTGKNIEFYLLIMLKYGIISGYNPQYFLRKEVEDHAISYNH